MGRKIRRDFVRLPLTGAYNVRDLGGYAGWGKKPTKFHVYLRTDDLSQITEKDKQFLKDYGVTAAVDLRGREEADLYPNPFREDQEVSYINIPFITEGVIDLRKIQISGFHVPEFYRQLVDSHGLVKQIMEFIGKQKGCVLFHCMAGKDRTGVLAMLLLGLCGVAKEDIVANYQVTRTYLKDYVDLHLEEELKDLEYSKGEWMEETYEYLIDKYGSFEGYFTAVGLSEKTVRRLKKRLIGI